MRDLDMKEAFQPKQYRLYKKSTVGIFTQDHLRIDRNKSTNNFYEIFVLLFLNFT